MTKNDDQPEQLILRCMRNLDRKVDGVAHKVDEIPVDLRSVKTQIAGLVTINGAFLDAETRQDNAISEIRERLDRIERRVDITD